MYVYSIFKKKSTINLPAIFRVLGWLLIMEALFMAAPLVVGLVYEEWVAVEAMLYSMLITAGVGAAMTFGLKPKSMDMHKREGILLTPVVWVFFSAFGMLPFFFTHSIDNVASAFMETMSGFTTTGLTVITDVEVLPKAVLFWRAMMHWVGGMGIILFSLAVLPMLNHSGGMQLFNAEVTGITHDKLRPRISSTAKGLWMVYIALTGMLCVLLWAGPMNFFDAVCHSMSALSTGGFSTKNASIAWWDSTYVDLAVTIFMFLGGVNFALIYHAACGNTRALSSNATFRWHAGTVLVATAMCVAYILMAGTDGRSVWHIIVDALFTCTSAITTTGFIVTDFEAWGQFVIMVLCIIMFFGSCAGSTSGGAKIDRMELMAKNIKNELYRVLHPNSVVNVRINQRVVPYDVVTKAIVFLGIYLSIIVLGTLTLTAFSIPMEEAFFSSVSALSNVGLGVGTATGGCFAVYPDAAKWVMSFMMLLGRLELFTLLVIFTSNFWVKN